MSKPKEFIISWNDKNGSIDITCIPDFFIDLYPIPDNERYVQKSAYIKTIQALKKLATGAPKKYRTEGLEAMWIINFVKETLHELGE